MLSRSPRSTAPYHTLAHSPRRTPPTKTAVGAIQGLRVDIGADSIERQDQRGRHGRTSLRGWVAHRAAGAGQLRARGVREQAVTSEANESGTSSRRRAVPPPWRRCRRADQALAVIAGGEPHALQCLDEHGRVRLTGHPEVVAEVARPDEQDIDAVDRGDLLDGLDGANRLDLHHPEHLVVGALQRVGVEPEAARPGVRGDAAIALRRVPQSDGRRRGPARRCPAAAA